MQTARPTAAALDRNQIARWLLAVLSVFGIVALILERGTGNVLVQGFAMFMIVAAPLIVWLARRQQRASLPRLFLLIFMTGMLLAGNLSQLHRPPNLVWLAVFPFVFFYLGGLRTGLLLSGLGLLSLLTSYLLYDSLQTVAPVGPVHFAQVVSAYLLCALLAFLYERENARHHLLLQQQAMHDYLTALPNRRGFSEVAPMIVSQSARLSQPCSLIAIDIDHFKSVNDRLGHAAGDALLTEIGKMLRHRLRETDLLARWGGEEFVALLPNTSLETAKPLAEELRLLFMHQSFGEAGPITASFGVAVHHVGEPLESFIERADQALYRAKHEGRNRVEAAPLPA